MKKIIVFILGVSIFTTKSFSGFFFDPTGAKEITQLAGWAAQAKRWKEHLEKIKKEIALKSGIRDVLSFEKDLNTLVDVLDKYSIDFMSLEDDILDKPKSQVGLYAKELFNKYNVFDNCNYEYLSDLEKKSCKNKMIRNVTKIATYQITNKKLSEIGENLKILAKKRAESKDIKESIDIGNAIQMQIAKLQVIRTQLMMMENQQKAKTDIEEIQSQQINDKKSKIMPEY